MSHGGYRCLADTYGHLASPSSPSSNAVNAGLMGNGGSLPPLHVSTDTAGVTLIQSDAVIEARTHPPGPRISGVVPYLPLVRGEDISDSERCSLCAGDISTPAKLSRAQRRKGRSLPQSQRSRVCEVCGCPVCMACSFTVSAPLSTLLSPSTSPSPSDTPPSTVTLTACPTCSQGIVSACMLGQEVAERGRGGERALRVRVERGQGSVSIEYEGGTPHGERERERERGMQAHRRPLPPIPTHAAQTLYCSDLPPASLEAMMRGIEGERRGVEGEREREEEADWSRLEAALTRSKRVKRERDKRGRRKGRGSETEEGENAMDDTLSFTVYSPSVTLRRSSGSKRSLADPYSDKGVTGKTSGVGMAEPSAHASILSDHPLARQARQMVACTILQNMHFALRGMEGEREVLLGERENSALDGWSRLISAYVEAVCVALPLSAGSGADTNPDSGIHVLGGYYCGDTEEREAETLEGTDTPCPLSPHPLSRVVQGIALECHPANSVSCPLYPHSPSSMPRTPTRGSSGPANADPHPSAPCILLVDGDVTPLCLYPSLSLSLSDVIHAKESGAEARACDTVVQSILSLGPPCILLCSGTVHQGVADRLEGHGVLCVPRVGVDTLHSIACASRGVVVESCLSMVLIGQRHGTERHRVQGGGGPSAVLGVGRKVDLIPVYPDASASIGMDTHAQGHGHIDTELCMDGRSCMVVRHHILCLSIPTLPAQCSESTSSEHMYKDSTPSVHWSLVCLGRQRGVHTSTNLSASGVVHASMTVARHALALGRAAGSLFEVLSHMVDRPRHGSVSHGTPLHTSLADGSCPSDTEPRERERGRGGRDRSDSLSHLSMHSLGGYLTLSLKRGESLTRSLAETLNLDETLMQGTEDAFSAAAAQTGHGLVGLPSPWVHGMEGISSMDTLYTDSASAPYLLSVVPGAHFPQTMEGHTLLETEAEREREEGPRSMLDTFLHRLSLSPPLSLPFLDPLLVHRTRRVGEDTILPTRHLYLSCVGTTPTLGSAIHTYMHGERVVDALLHGDRRLRIAVQGERAPPTKGSTTPPLSPSPSTPMPLSVNGVCRQCRRKVTLPPSAVSALWGVPMWAGLSLLLHSPSPPLACGHSVYAYVWTVSEAQGGVSAKASSAKLVPTPRTVQITSTPLHLLVPHLLSQRVHTQGRETRMGREHTPPPSLSSDPLQPLLCPLLTMAEGVLERVEGYVRGEDGAEGEREGDTEAGTAMRCLRQAKAQAISNLRVRLHGDHDAMHTHPDRVAGSYMPGGEADMQCGDHLAVDYVTEREEEAQGGMERDGEEGMERGRAGAVHTPLPGLSSLSLPVSDVLSAEDLGVSLSSDALDTRDTIDTLDRVDTTLAVVQDVVQSLGVSLSLDTQAGTPSLPPCPVPSVSTLLSRVAHSPETPTHILPVAPDTLPLSTPTPLLYADPPCLISHALRSVGMGSALHTLSLPVRHHLSILYQEQRKGLERSEREEGERESEGESSGGEWDEGDILCYDWERLLGRDLTGVGVGVGEVSSTLDSEAEDDMGDTDPSTHDDAYAYPPLSHVLSWHASLLPGALSQAPTFGTDIVQAEQPLDTDHIDYQRQRAPDVLCLVDGEGDPLPPLREADLCLEWEGEGDGEYQSLSAPTPLSVLLLSHPQHPCMRHLTHHYLALERSGTAVAVSVSVLYPMHFRALRHAYIGSVSDDASPSASAEGVYCQNWTRAEGWAPAGGKSGSAFYRSVGEGSSEEGEGGRFVMKSTTPQEILFLESVFPSFCAYLYRALQADRPLPSALSAILGAYIVHTTPLEACTIEGAEWGQMERDTPVETEAEGGVSLPTLTVTVDSAQEAMGGGGHRDWLTSLISCGVCTPHKRETSRHILTCQSNIRHSHTFQTLCDIKGSMRNRHVSGSPTPDTQTVAKTAVQPDIVYKDENVVRGSAMTPFVLTGCDKARVLRSVHNDSALLHLWQVVDYSALLGVQKVETDTSHTTGHTHPIPHTGSVDTTNSDPRLVVGVIDYLRAWSLACRVESLVKRVGGKVPTIVRPALYRRRFMAAMSRILVEVPQRVEARQAGGVDGLEGVTDMAMEYGEGST
ncbi:hypothetical protein KIPB_002856 [Kipferlia bialata]|uniref:PIPK domain-containing protein n=1 Tax=Kipferlia bialata TaxID=797122 RepID=A0A9K3CSE7_9EUKA|nr:hypothetical protein KIPB_002856 [Kipferlia bialata]|eukprot:g2856.t1